MKESQSSSLPDAVITSRPRFSLVWVVPIVALIIGGWLIYDDMAKRGPTITITFQDGSGLEAGKTVIDYKGVKVGLVSSVKLAPDLKTVNVIARLDKSAESLASEGTLFWVVRPEIGVEGIRGLDTLLSGQYIAVQPGTGKSQTTFNGLENPPPAGPDKPGINLLLQADRLGSLEMGSPIYYREVKVGEVDRYRLADDSGSVLIHIHIDKPYDALIRENTRFWNASGIGVSLGLLGVKVQTESLAALLSGGVGFATPDNDNMGGPVPSGAVFELSNDLDESWLKWKPSIPLDFTGSDASGSLFPNAATMIHEPTTTTPAAPSAPVSPSPPSHGMPGHH